MGHHGGRVKSRIAIVGGLAVLAAAVGWVALRERGPGVTPPGSPEPALPTSRSVPPDPAAQGARDASPVSTCSIHGVVLRDGKPAAAMVEAWQFAECPGDLATWADEEAWEWESDLLPGGDLPALRGATGAAGDGAWAFEDLPPGKWLFRASTPDGAVGFEEVTLHPPGPGADTGGLDRALEIEIAPATCSLRGRALRPDGSPFRGLILLREDWRPVALPVEAGPGGEFRFPAVPRTLVRLLACERGRRLVPGPRVLLPCEEEVPFVVGTGLVEIAGRVLEPAGERGVAGARVLATFSDGGERTTTDGEGRFRFRLPEGERPRIRADAPGFLPTTLDDILVPPGGGPPVVLRLHRPSRLSGTVRGHPGGEPAAGARVAVLVSRRDLYSTVEPIRGAAGPDGRYEIGALPPGRWTVVVAGGGFASKDLAGPEPWDPVAAEVDLPEGGAATLDLLAVAAPSLRGRVLDADGKGVPGMEVEVAAVEILQRSLDPADAFEAESLRTAEDGGFETRSLLPGVPFEVRAVRGSVPWAIARVAPLEAGGTAEVELRLPAERLIEVRVVDEESGGPLAGMRVCVMAEMDPGSPGSRWGWPLDGATGEDGTVTVGPIPSVPIEIRAGSGSDPWGTAGERRELLPPFEPSVVLRAKGPVAAAGLSVEGRVLRSDGSPASHADWRATPDAEPGGFGRSGTADFRGRFRIGDLPEGGLSISSWPRGGGEVTSVTARAGDTGVRLVLRDAPAADDSPRPALRLRFLDPARRPVRGGKVHVAFPDAKAARDEWRSSDADLVDGVAAVPVPPGATKCWLFVAGAREGGGEGRLLADALHGPLDAGAGEFEAALDAGRVLAGRVVDPEGRPVPGARVTFHADYPDLPQDVSFWTEVGVVFADSAGAFRFEGAGDREYAIEAGAAGDYFGSEKAKGRGGDTAVVVRMRKAASALVTVLDSAGKPVAGAAVDLTIPHFHDRARDVPVTNASGKARLTGLHPDGGYTLTVRPPADRGDLMPEEIEDWTPADRTVRLAPAHAFVVRVQDGSGRPVPAVSVMARWGDDARSFRHGDTGEDGTVGLARIPEGPIEITASLKEATCTADPAAAKTVDGRSGGVTLTVDTGVSMRVSVPCIGKECRVFLHLGTAGDIEPIRYVVTKGEEVRIRGLRAGDGYDLYAEEHSEPRGFGAAATAPRCALLRGVRPGAGPVEVTLSPAGSVTGRVLLPPGWALLDEGILVGDALLIRGGESDSDNGTFRIDGVPDGRWKVRVRIWSKALEETRTLEAEAEAGGEVEIDAR